MTSAFAVGYAENAASELLTLYKTNLAFAKLTDAADDSRTATVTTPAQQDLLPDADPPRNDVKVGDYVQWTSNDQEQFETPRRVTWVSDDGAHVRVFGSMTGLPVAEVSVVDAPAGAPPPSVHAERKPLVQLAERPDINVLMTAAGRLEITADVDEEGLKTLRAMLDKYEEILKLLAPIHNLNKG